MGKGLLDSLRTEEHGTRESRRLQFVFRQHSGQIDSFPHRLPVNDAPQGPLDVHAMADARHTQVQVVVLGEGGQVRAIDLVVQETLSVLTQVQVAKPICDVVLGPVWQRLGGKRLCGGRRRQMRVT